MKKRFLSLLLAIVMIFTMIPLDAFAAEFNDVEKHWAENSIKRLSNIGIVNGSNGNFRPNDNITRAEVATIFTNMMGYKTVGDNTFTDLLSGKWYKEAMLKANAEGIFTGSGDGKISPEKNITRQEFFVTLARVLKLEDVSGNLNFVDNSEISSWATGKINALVKEGFLTGVKNVNGTYSLQPIRTITRGEVVSVIDRAFEGIINKTGIYKINVDNNLVVNTDNVTLFGITVGGDLFVAPGVSDGETILNNTKVLGRTIIQGGGENSIIFKGSSILNDIRTLKNQNENPISLKFYDDSSANIINVDSNSAKTTIYANDNSVVNTIIVNNNSTQVLGKGKVNKVIVNANNVMISTPNTRIEVAQGIVGTIAGGIAVEGGKIVTINANGNGILADYANAGDDSEQEPEEPNPVNTDSYKITFVTNGGDSINPVYVKKANPILDNVPSPRKADNIFLGWYRSTGLLDSDKFYNSEAITSDITLYAKYAEIGKPQQKKDNSFAKQDVGSDFALEIVADGKTAEGVKSLITVETIGAPSNVELDVIKSGNKFIITAKDGYREGSAYKLTLGDGLYFYNMDEEIRNCTFTVAKEEVLNANYNEDIIYVENSKIEEFSPITEEGGTATIIFVNASDASNLKSGDIISIYDGTKPTERTDKDANYSDEKVVYAKVLSVSGNKVTYKAPETKELIALPEVLPLYSDDDIIYDGYSNSLQISKIIDDEYWIDYDHIGLDASTKLDIGDTIVIFGEDEEDVIYGIVKSKADYNDEYYIITFEKTTANAIVNETDDYYTNDEMDFAEIVEQVNASGIKEKIKQQALESGFANEALLYLASVASKTDGFKEFQGLKSFTIKDKDGNIVKADTISPNWVINLPDLDPFDDIDVKVTISNNIKHFPGGLKGLSCTVVVSGELEYELNDESKIVVELEASFEQEIRIVFNVDSGIIWKWAGPIPYPSDYQLNANVDIYNYTGIGVKAIVSSKSVDDTIIDFTDISEEIENLLAVTDDEELATGVQDIFEAYGKMLENETDYITLVKAELFEKEKYLPYGFVVSFGADFVIKANINVVLGSEFTYQCANRYNFWFTVIKRDSGSSTMQLADEEMRFTFYIMGELGLKVGVELEFKAGWGSLDLASLGLVVETGAYTELYGYFIYQITKINDISDSKVAGALYLEFGIYFELSFKAAAIGEKFVYQPTLYENQWPLLSAGERVNVYEFAYDKKGEDIGEFADKFVIKNFTTGTLPNSYFNMKCLDLMTGDLYSDVLPYNKFEYNLSNPNFTLKDGVITVNVPENIRYMECDLTITWKGAKLAFSKGDLSRKIKLVWTNLTDAEMSIRHNISVVANNQVVWSTVVGEGIVPELPSLDEIKELLEFDKYTSEGINLKYNSFGEYNINIGAVKDHKDMGLDFTGSTTNPAVPAVSDQVYYVDVTAKEYKLIVSGVQDTNGNERTVEFTAKFGEKFDLSSLQATGTKIEGEKYTRYMGVVSKMDAELAGTTNLIAADSVIDAKFAKQLLNGAVTYEADYIDNTVEVTYRFVDSRGRLIDDKDKSILTIKIEKDTIPNFDYYAYITTSGTVSTGSAIGGSVSTGSGISTTGSAISGWMVKRWDKEIGKVNANEIFTAVCVKYLPGAAEWTIEFETNNSDYIEPMSRYHGAHVTLPTLSREGYTFGGWYTDSGNKVANSLNCTEDLNLYAYWTSNIYKVTYDVNANGLPIYISKETVELAYGTDYAQPTLVRSGYKFMGWALNTDESTPVIDVNTAKDHILKAIWVEKNAVAYKPNFVKQSYDYNRAAQAFKLTDKISGDEIPADYFYLTYKGKYYEPTNEWFENSPVDHDEYAVMIYRPEDENTKMFKVVVTDGLTINKINRECTISAPTSQIGKTSNSVTVAPAVVTGIGSEDGDIKYSASLYSKGIFGNNASDGAAPSDESAWTTSLTISNLQALSEESISIIHYKIYAKIAGGRNYYDLVSEPLIGTTEVEKEKVNHNMDFTVKTSDKTNAGTDMKVYAWVRNYDNTDLYYQLKSGSNDFGRNSLRTYNVSSNYDIWMINEIGIDVDKSLLHWDGWHGEYMDVTIDGQKLERITMDRWFDENGDKATYPIGGVFKRNITDIGSFKTWSGTYDINSSSSGKLSFVYDGTITDQYGTYNAYDFRDAPIITLDRDMKYRDVISYSNYGIEIDKQKLYAEMLKNNEDTITLNVTLKFNPRSTNNTDATMFTKTIIINRK